MCDCISLSEVRILPRSMPCFMDVFDMQNILNRYFQYHYKPSLPYQEPIQDTFTVVSTSCPPGYVLSAAPLQGNMYTTCTCDNNNPNIVNCSGDSIILKVSRLYTQVALQQDFTIIPFISVSLIPTSRVYNFTHSPFLFSPRKDCGLH